MEAVAKGYYHQCLRWSPPEPGSAARFGRDRFTYGLLSHICFRFGFEKGPQLAPIRVRTRHLNLCPLRERSRHGAWISTYSCFQISPGSKLCLQSLALPRPLLPLRSCYIYQAQLSCRLARYTLGRGVSSCVCVGVRQRTNGYVPRQVSRQLGESLVRTLAREPVVPHPVVLYVYLHVSIMCMHMIIPWTSTS